MHEDLERLDGGIAAALAGLSAEQMRASPTDRPGKWSIQQIVEHLQQTYRTSVRVIETRLEKGTPTRAVPTLQQGLGQFFVIRLGRFPSGREAPAAVLPFVPSVPISGAELGGRVHTELEQLDGVAAEGERVFGKGRSVSHIILGPLSMGQWRRFHLIHGRHHLRQILKIRRQHGF